MRSFGQLVREKRIENGHTIRSLEKALIDNQGVRVSRSYINLVEMEKRNPTYKIAYAMASELGIDHKTALRAAYVARLEYDENREKRYLEELIQETKSKDLKVSDIAKKP